MSISPSKRSRRVVLWWRSKPRLEKLFFRMDAPLNTGIAETKRNQKFSNPPRGQD